MTTYLNGRRVPLPSKHAIGVANAHFKVLLMKATVLPMHLNYKQRNTHVNTCLSLYQIIVHRYNAMQTDNLIHCILSLQIFVRMHGFAQDYYNRQCMAECFKMN